MTCFKDALLLLEDLEELASCNEFPEIENLIQNTRKALEMDLGGELKVQTANEVSAKFTLEQ